MERFLEKYHPLTREDVESCSKGSIEAFENGDLSEERMERLMRFTAMNRHIKQNGLAPLPVLQGAETEAPNMVNETTSEECDGLGLTMEEYKVLKGDYGTILGISVNKYVYQALMRKCKSKKAISVRQSESLSKRFIVKKMKKLVASIVRRSLREEIIASTKRPNILIQMFNGKPKTQAAGTASGS
jgi:hypothetical protein